MAYSLETMEDIRKSIMDTIAMVERENAVLSAKIDSLIEPSGPPSEVQDDEKFLEELALNENINGMSFKNVTKETWDSNTIMITADVISGKEECSLKIKAAADGTVRDFSLIIEDTSALMEIKQELSCLIEEVKLTYTLKAVASFSRMNDLRSTIIDGLLTRYEDFFKAEAVDVSGDCAAASNVVVTASSRNKRAKYFEATWNLSWNYGKIGIEHVFIVRRLKGLNKIPRLVPQLRKLEEKHFVDGKCSSLVKLWRVIGELIAEED